MPVHDEVEYKIRVVMLSSPKAPPFRTLGYGAAFLVTAGLGLLFFKGPQGLPAFRAKWAHVQASEKINSDLKREIEEMKVRNLRLRTDQEEIKLEIRDALGKQEKGEVILKLPERAKRPTPSQ